MRPLRLVLVALGSLLILAGIGSFLVLIARLATLALLLLGAAAVVGGAWVIDD